MNYESHRWHPLHALSLTNLLRSFLLIFALNLLKEVSFLSFILNFDHKNGPKSLTSFPAKWPLWNERRNSILTTRHHPDLGSAFDCFLRLFSYSLPHASLFFFSAHISRRVNFSTVSNHRILAFRRLLTEASTVVKNKQNKIDTDHSKPLLTDNQFHSALTATKKKKENIYIYIFLDLPHDKSLDLL